MAFSGSIRRAAPPVAEPAAARKSLRSTDFLASGGATSYPVIYAKQMARGFEAHTGRRAMVYSAGGYTGVQQFVASWAGDTGGGAKPLASMLNLAFSGHSNHSCDMDVTKVEGIHFGSFTCLPARSWLPLTALA